MEECLKIDFECKPEHIQYWDKAFELLTTGQRGWQLQDAIDPINKAAADALDDVWEALPHGSESFEVFAVEVKGTQCHLKLMAGSMVIDALEKALIPWLQQCGVLNLTYSLSSDDD